jgi:putative transposase
MRDWQSLAHVRWECKYHIVWVPKYRRKVLYGKVRRRFGEIVRDLCRQLGVEVIEGHAMVDHVHLSLRAPWFLRRPVKAINFFAAFRSWLVPSTPRILC